jgi:hypothetical protein
MFYFRFIFLFLITLTIVTAKTTYSSEEKPFIYNKTQEPNVENNFKEKKYFQSSDVGAAAFVTIMSGIVKPSKEKNSSKKLKTDFEDHKKFNK